MARSTSADSRTTVKVTATAETIRYIVSDNSFPTPVIALNGWDVTSTTSSSRVGYVNPDDRRASIFGNTTTSTYIAFDAYTVDEGGTTSTSNFTASCTDYGTSIAIVETWPGSDSSAGGQTWTLLDCFEAMAGMDAKVKTLYRTVNAIITLATPAASSTDRSSSAESTTTSLPADLDPPSKDSNKPSAGVIAGATIGSVAGLLLLIGIGVWLRRRRAAERTTDGGSSRHGYTVSLAWGRSPAGRSEGDPHSATGATQDNPPVTAQDAPPGSQVGYQYPKPELPVPESGPGGEVRLELK